MSFSSPVRLAAVAAAVLLARPVHGLTLAPVPCAGRNNTAIAPRSNVTLQYGNDAGSPSVNVSLAMQQPTVLLEEIAAVTAVDCNASSVAVTFNSSAAFDAAAAAWSIAENLLFITNHLGDCDVELERGFFLADAITALNASLTVVASTAKTSVNETAADVDISFAGIPPVDAAAKRAITANPSFTVADSLELPSTVLFTDAPYITVTADEAVVSASATLSGTIKFSVLTLSLQELTVDFNTSLSAELAVTVAVDAAYSTTAAYTAPALEYDVVNVPGILELGPALLFSVGVDLAVDGAVNVTADVSMALANGNVHVDFQDESASSATGWTPTYTAGVNISEQVAGSVDPYVDVTVELACTVLGGLLDLSVGLEAEPRVHAAFVLAASQDVSAASGLSMPSSNCSQGLDLTADFAFALVAKVTEFWSGTLVNLTVPIVDECYSFV